ncbi:hypothetical protein FIBSPDRAFT_857291 [Athelia psychrophila]|uniref:Uncharacterized protein n=1 Tax=Athelia psychrophila TaxID=1759441 RepID=A0A166MRM8_9AGAM|nr:hypothetical protein FIBSPDRAFT_857291 [Fibularhizoctonia sp. CBS 109695]
MRTGLNIPIVVYHVSRGTTLAFCIWAVLTSAGSVGTNIFTTTRVVWCIRWASAASTSLLFFFRVRAVYCHSRPVVALFAVLWALILLTPIAGLFGLIHNCDGSVCQDGNPLALTMDLSIFLHDTLVFLCISHKIYGNAFSSTPLPKSRTANFKRFFSGQGLYAVSKALLLSGQLYYALTIGVLIIAVPALYTGLPYSDVLEVLYVTLSSALACRVFRMLLLCTRETEDATLSLRAVEAMPMAELSITADKTRPTGDFPP